MWLIAERHFTVAPKSSILRSCAATTALLCILTSVVLVNCSGARTTRVTRPIPAWVPPTPPPSESEVPGDAYSPLAAEWGSEYIDIRAGWRLRVTYPLLKSGGYQVTTTQETVEGRAITLSSDAELEGYEVDLYNVRPATAGGVRIEFTSSAVTKNGQTFVQPSPKVLLFQVPLSLRFVRLLYAVQGDRVNNSRHEMALMAADEEAVLEANTTALQRDWRNCTTDEHKLCSWIPAGIAVLPEEHVTGEKDDSWRSVR